MLAVIRPLNHMLLTKKSSFGSDSYTLYEAKLEVIRFKVLLARGLVHKVEAQLAMAMFKGTGADPVVVPDGILVKIEEDVDLSSVPVEVLEQIRKDISRSLERVTKVTWLATVSC